MKKRICVIIRVYNRVEDLEYCLDVIRDTWTILDYYVVVVSNGRSKGFIINDACKSKIDHLVDLEINAGHFKGNSQLLLEGLPFIPDDCEHTILLEADTWLYGDALIKKYADRLTAEGAVWASAQFYSYVLNLATDFAIVDSKFIRNHPQVVTFEGIPEYYVANYLQNRGFKFIYITEIAPVNLPRYLRKYPFAPTGRFFVFPAAKMVTHHIEDLKGGMEEKKYFFNALANEPYFDVACKRSYKKARSLIKMATLFFYIIPHKGWIFKNKKFDV